MKYVKNSNTPLICGAILLLTIGLVIGLNINKKEVYTIVDMVASNADASSGNEVDFQSEEVERKSDENKTDIKTDKSIKDTNTTKNITSDKKKTNDNIVTEDTQSTNSSSDNNSTTNISTYSSNDNTVINSLESSLTKINNGSTSDSSFSDSAKGVFVSIVDFYSMMGKLMG